MDMVLYEKPVKIEITGNILLVNGNQHPKDTRTLQQMKPTLREDVEGNGEIYYMYRNVYKDNEIRFDITVIPANPLGDECPKTHGHYHPKSPDGPSYPEVYQVLHGSAVFLLQRRNRSESVDVILVDGKKGDVILIPPGYGHTTINNGKESLVLANLVYDKFDSLYDEYKKNRGGAYYYLKDHEIVQNTNYMIHKNERISAAELNDRYDFSCKDMLQEFYTDPHKFAFLMKPNIIV